MGLPIRQRQTLQDFTLAGDSTQLAALVHSGHAKAAVALHAAPHQQPVPRLKDIQLHFLPYVHCRSELAFVASCRVNMTMHWFVDGPTVLHQQHEGCDKEKQSSGCLKGRDVDVALACA